MTITMKPEEQLELLNQVITKSNTEKDFFVCLGRYVKHILDNKFLSDVVQKNFVQRQDDILQEIHTLETPARVEIDASYEQLKKIIHEQKLVEPAITKALEDYEHIVTGRSYSLSGQSVTQDLYEQVGYIIAELQDKGFTDIISPFVAYDERTGNIIHKFAPSFHAYDTAFDVAKKKQKIVEEWGDWFELQLVYDVIYRIPEILDDLKSKGAWSTYSNYQLLSMEMERVIKGEGRPDERIHFKQTIYTGHLNRFHVSFLIFLSQSSTAKTEMAELSTSGTQFDDSKGILRVGIVECEFPLSHDEHNLCRVMTNYNVNEPVDWSVVYEEMMGEELNGKKGDWKKAKKRVYDSHRRTNDTVREKLNTDAAFIIWKDNSLKRQF